MDPKCMNKIWYKHAMEYYSAIKRKNILIPGAMRMHYEDIVLTNGHLTLAVSFSGLEELGIFLCFLLHTFLYCFFSLKHRIIGIKIIK